MEGGKRENMKGTRRQEMREKREWRERRRREENLFDVGEESLDGVINWATCTNHNHHLKGRVKGRRRGGKGGGKKLQRGEPRGWR